MSSANLIEFPRRPAAFDGADSVEPSQFTDERLRLARDLHDVVSYSFATINVQAGVAVHLSQEQPDLAVEALEAIRAASRDALSEFRELIGTLRRADGSEAAQPAARLSRLDTLAATTTSAGVKTVLRVEGRPRPLPAAVDAAAFRIVQEALANVLHHARAASASVLIRYERRELIVEVTDDGAAAAAAGDKDRSDGSGKGIVGMRERVAALGGDLEAGPQPEGGFRVRARLPLLVRL